MSTPRFGRHIKRPAPEDLKPAGDVPRYQLRDVLPTTVQNLFNRSKALRREAEEIQREAGTLLAIVDQKD